MLRDFLIFELEDNVVGVILEVDVVGFFFEVDVVGVFLAINGVRVWLGEIFSRTVGDL